MSLDHNTFYYYTAQKNGGTHFECGGIFDLNMIPVFLEMYEAHLLNFVVNKENLKDLYSTVSMEIYNEKERLEILLDKINITSGADDSESEKKEIGIGNYYKYYSILKPAANGQVFWACGLIPDEQPSSLSGKVKAFSEKLVVDMGNLGQLGGVGYNPTKSDKSILEL